MALYNNNTTVDTSVDPELRGIPQTGTAIDTTQPVSQKVYIDKTYVDNNTEIINDPGGNRYEVQFNYGSSFKGDSGFTYDPVTKLVTIRGNINLGGYVKGKIVTNFNNFKLSGGTNGQVLATDGLGNLSWVDQTGGSGGGNGNSWSSWAVTGQNTLTADGEQTIQIIAGTNMSIITNTSNNSIRFDAVYSNTNVENFISTYGGHLTGGNLVITGTGHFYNINAAGNANIETLNVNAQSRLGSVGNVKITGGTNGQILATDGTGNLSWVAPQSGPTGPQGDQGPQGDPGPAGADGADALWNFKGAYDNVASYAIGDVVTYGGETWYRIDANFGEGGDIPVEGTFWTKIAQKGADGTTGSGITGWTVSTGNHLLPNTDNLQDIGSPGSRIRHIYVGPGSVTIGDSIITESTTGKLVLPGVTRATTLFAEEVEDTADQIYVFGGIPFVTDAYDYSIRAGLVVAPGGYVKAEYSVDQIDNDGYIDDITVDVPGTWTQAIADINKRNSMYAYVGPDINEPFDVSNWIQIPFIVSPKADDVEYEFNTGGDADLGSFTIDSNVLSVNSGTDIYIETYETGGDGESRLILKPQDDDGGDNPTRIEGSYGVGIWANTTGTAKKWLFGSNGDLKLPAGGDIVDSNGNSVLGGVSGIGDIVVDVNDDQPGAYTSLTIEDKDFNIVTTRTDSENDADIHLTAADDIWIEAEGDQAHLSAKNDVIIGTGWNDGTASKEWIFDDAGAITFPDNTVQTTAYTGQSGGGSTVARQDTAPSASNGTLWFNTEEARMYIKYNDQWVDSSPVIIPPPQTELDVNSITFADATTLTSAYTNKLVNGVHEVLLNSEGVLRLADDLILPRTSRWIKDCEGSGGTTSMRWYNVPTDDAVELLRVYSGEAPNEEGTERAKINLEWQNTTVSGLSITSFDRTDGVTEHKWNFLGDGSLKFPGQSDFRIVEDEPGLVVTSEVGFAVVTNSVESAKNWLFGVDGDLTLPAGGDIKYSNGNSILPPQGEYIYEFDGTNTNLTITDLNFNLLYCKTALGYGGSDTHNVNLPAGTPGQRLVIVNITINCTLTVNGAQQVTVTSGPAEFIYTTNDDWIALYGTV